MAMNHIFATLACCLLAVSFAKEQAESQNLTPTTPTRTTVLNMTTFVTSSNSTVNATAVSNETENTTPFTSTTRDNKTFNETTSHAQTSQSTTIVTPLNNGTSLMTTRSGTNTSGFTELTTPAIQTTTGYNSTSNTTVLTTTYSSQTVNTTSDSEEKTTQALGLNNSEKSMTIVFSSILGLFAVALVVLMFRRCKHKFQYLHQPLNNTDDTDLFVPDDDTLVISGGLYDGHPIHDNVPTAPADQSQFRLEFLH